jgi:hypothetical protein
MCDRAPAIHSPALAQEERACVGRSRRTSAMSKAPGTTSVSTSHPENHREPPSEFQAHQRL